MRNSLSILLVVLSLVASATSVLMAQVARGADGPPAALPPSYDAVAGRCKDTGKAFVAWVGVRPRIVSGAVGLECSTFPDVRGAGIVVGVWRGEAFDRYDLPASATDAEIAAVYGGRAVAAAPAPVYVPPPVYVAPALPRYYYGSADCPPGGA
jgi:hypothetical protein